MIRVRHQSVAGVPTVVVERESRTWDAEALLGHAVDIGGVIGDMPGFVSSIEAALAEGRAEPVDREGHPFLVPTVFRPSVFCAGANFSDHVREMGEEPITRAFHFVSPPTVLSPHGAAIPRPEGAERLDWEVELVAVIGRVTSRVDEEDALASIAAFTVGNDVSVRGDPMHPIFGMDWGAGKNADGLTAVGPALVPAADVVDPQNLPMRLTVDGEVRQDSSSARMLVTVAQQIAAISRRTTLHPGDLVLTGTPAGTARAHANAYLRDGQTMSAEIDGVGVLVNRVEGTPTSHHSEGDQI
ncbi:fumarylacetoacetate hydrolase family protein [Microbacterium enclense]|uniref:fumarylacetoacetate hydrolase family protein n=1 Tax=Microbacterium enclense TaxID=993073 RepID=UPI0021A4335A|nr:fumarylacetoacetate hydrolase family protein [Microbacterium enclense]MCT2086881.1 fumarylacetoacetate hydrolase family protein [Microbacterium enclense]